MNLHLEQPLFLLLIPLGLLFIWKLVRQKGVIGFSSTALLEGIKTKYSLLFFEKLLLSLFLISCIIILARPFHATRTSVPIYSQARDIVIVLDISSSMESRDEPKLPDAIRVITQFTINRPSDRFALVTFDTAGYLEWPLSSDHQVLVYRLNHLNSGGGTKIATGMITGLKHLQQFGENSGALIVVSDGASEVSSEEKASIKDALGETQLYWIWIGEDTDDPLPLKFAIYVQSLGGKVYHGNSGLLEEFFKQISQLETSPVIWEYQVTTDYDFGVLPTIALTSLFLAALIHLLREV